MEREWDTQRKCEGSQLTWRRCPWPAGWPESFCPVVRIRGSGSGDTAEHQTAIIRLRKCRWEQENKVSLEWEKDHFILRPCCDGITTFLGFLLVTDLWFGCSEGSRQKWTVLALFHKTLWLICMQKIYLKVVFLKIKARTLVLTRAWAPVSIFKCGPCYSLEKKKKKNRFFFFCKHILYFY